MLQSPAKIYPFILSGPTLEASARAKGNLGVGAVVGTSKMFVFPSSRVGCGRNDASIFY